MKAPLTSFFGNKTVTALIFSLVLVGGVAFIFNEPFEQASADTVVGGGKGDGGTPPVGGGDIGGEEGVIPSGTPLCGFAWGGTNEGVGYGVGWISFNSKDCDTNGDGTFNDGVAGCPTSGNAANYGVSVDTGGRLNGFAWSSNIGWIKFGCTAGNNCLDYSSIGLQGAGRAVINDGGTVRNVQGWIRACSGSQGGDCSSASRTDGWDGWINLMGNSSYGVKFNTQTQKFSGYAWGDKVVGWLNFAPVQGNEVRYCTALNVTAELTADPDSGPSPVEGVDLIVDIGGTATGNSIVKFDCTNDGIYEHTNMSVPGSSYRVDNLCNYTSDATAKVEVTRGSVEGVGTTEIRVAPIVTGDLTVNCVVIDPVMINQPATWTATITPGLTPAVAPYTYEFIFDDGQPNPVPLSNSELSQSVNRTYNILGEKSVIVNVRDGAQTATGSCTAETSVIVNPTIIEI